MYIVTTCVLEILAFPVFLSHAWQGLASNQCEPFVLITCQTLNIHLTHGASVMIGIATGTR